MEMSKTQRTFTENMVNKSHVLMDEWFWQVQGLIWVFHVER